MAHMESELQQLPDRFLESVLHKNLHALAEINLELAERLCLPVRSSHVHFDDAGRASLQLSRTRLPLELTQNDVRNAFKKAEGSTRVLILGIGLGELVRDGLQGSTASTVLAWDRDPWLLRLLLMGCDYSSELRSKQLQLALGTDLLSMDVSAYPTATHPLLAQIYQMELEALAAHRESHTPRYIGLCTGGLFVDELASAFKAKRLTPWPLDIEGVSQEELSVTANALNLEFIAAINYSEGLSEFSSKHNIPLLCWEIDPAATKPRPAPTDTQNTHLFLHREKNVDLFCRAGYQNARYLPLAADPVLRRPRPLSDEETKRYGASVSFVGGSLLANSKKLFQQFVDAYCHWRAQADDAGQAARELAGRALAAQVESESEYILPSALEHLAPGFMKATLGRPEHQDPAALLAETASCRRRARFLSAIQGHDLHVWGDEGWRGLERPDLRYRGPAGHRSELTRIYNASAINLDIGRLTQNDIVTMRVFDILACGAFVIAEHNDALTELFEIGVEVESYSTPSELISKIEFYLAYPDKAVAIAKRGMQAVLSRHTIDHRVDTMLSALELRLASAEKR